MVLDTDYLLHNGQVIVTGGGGRGRGGKDLQGALNGRTSRLNLNGKKDVPEIYEEK